MIMVIFLNLNKILFREFLTSYFFISSKNLRVRTYFDFSCQKSYQNFSSFLSLSILFTPPPPNNALIEIGGIEPLGVKTELVSFFLVNRFCGAFKLLIDRIP